MINYNSLYNKSPTVFGARPSDLAKNVLQLASDTCGKTILDLGAGQGRDSAFFASNGFTVTAVEKSQTAFIQLSKLKPALAVINADIMSYEYEKGIFDVIFANNVLHILERAKAEAVLKKMTESVTYGGLIAVSVLEGDNRITKDAIREATRECKTLYLVDEEIIDHGHPGEPLPHKHKVFRIIAQKVV